MTSALQTADVPSCATRAYPWLSALPQGRGLAPEFHACAAVRAARFGGRQVRLQAGHQFPRQDVDLQGDCAGDRPRRGRPAEARRQEGHQGRAASCPIAQRSLSTTSPRSRPAATVVNYNPLYTLEELTFQVKDSETELMVTLDLKVLFDKVEALMKAGTLKRAIVASFPALLPGAKSVLFKLFKSQGAGPPDQIRGGQEHRARRRRAEQRRQVPEGRDRPAQRRRGAAVHGRHHRHAQGRHADPRQRRHQRAAGQGLGDQPAVGRGAGAGGAAVLPRVRHDGGDELRAVAGRRAHHHAALRARRRHEADRQDQADGDAGRADHVHRHAQPPQAQELRPVVAQVLPVGRRAAAGRGQAALREADRLQAGRGLRPVRDLARRHLQPAGRAGEGRLDRPAAARHHRLAARSGRSLARRCRSARRARSASRVRRS